MHLQGYKIKIHSFMSLLTRIDLLIISDNTKGQYDTTIHFYHDLIFTELMLEMM